MAIAHSASSESSTGTTGSIGTVYEWTHTQTGTPSGIIVFVITNGSSSNAPGTVTYSQGSTQVTLTHIANATAFDSAGEQGIVYVHHFGRLDALPSGDQIVSVSRDTLPEQYAVACTYTANADTILTGFVLLQGDLALAQQNVNDGSPGHNTLRYAGGFSGLAAVPAAGANSTLLQSIDFGNQTMTVVRETTAGQGSRPVGVTGASDDVAFTHFAVVERPKRLTLIS